MRHVLLPCAIAPRTLGMGEATSAAHLVAPAGLLLGAAPGVLCTASSTVDLAAIAVAAHQHLEVAARAHKDSGRRFDRHSRTSRRALDEIPNE